MSGDRAPERPALAPEVAALIARGRLGDRPALAALIGRYQGRVARFVLAETGDDQHYEDLCQTIFVRMALGLKGLRAPERFEPWLFQIARNVCRDHHRRRRGWRRLFVSYEPSHEAVPTPEPPPPRRGEENLERSIARLPPSQQHLLRLALDGERSYAELARLSGASVPAVKSRLYRARETLRGMLLAGETE
jgi:RNA polymerase sigma-70 factor (ECF subfamily)